VAAWLQEAASVALPAGVFQVVRADARQTATLIESGGVDAISFTGSVAVGRRLAVLAATHGLPIQCEMGGQNAVVVLEDADLDAAAGIIAGAGMAFAGQKCTATRRVVVVEPIRAALTERLVARTLALAVGDPLTAATTVGPVISDEARAGIGAAVDAAVRDGSARRLAAATTPDEGWFVAPTLLEVDDPRATIAQEEVFGPVVSILGARDEDDAIRIANATRFGLSAAVYGRDPDRAARVAGQLEAGLVRVNAPTTGVDFHAPFGGQGESSVGVREQGRAARELFTVTRTVTIVPGG
jgi:aldehyde dehydrogenase (NAD+)